MNAVNYVEVLETALVDHADQLMGEEIIFQQDNASIHSARYTMNFLQERNIPVLDWPACSHDLKPIENLWAVTRLQGGRQFLTVADLKTGVRRPGLKSLKICCAT